MAHRLPCPTCGREIEWSDAFPFRPFCSERCRLIDLGAWLSDERSIPGEPADGIELPPERADAGEPDAPAEPDGSADAGATETRIGGAPARRN